MTDALDRRGLLACMAWAGAGLLWTVGGGVPRALLLGEAAAADRVEGAVLYTLEQGRAVTQDLARQTGGALQHARPHPAAAAGLAKPGSSCIVRRLLAGAGRLGPGGWA